jgi:hypothetical protein
MSHHGREGEVEACGRTCGETYRKLSKAVELITAIAFDKKVDPSASCDTWLELNGYECEASRRKQRERRADQLDAEINRLRAERAKL